jgi:hypothetical protein
LPGNLEIRIRVEEARELPSAENPQIMPAETFVETAHRALDAETFQALHNELYDVIGRPDPVECGWVIEAGLRDQLWVLWQIWQAALEADAGSLRRFLVLLADAQDYTDAGERALVRVGPKTVRAHLLKATIFALAFVFAAERPLTPATKHPGNLQGEGAAGHACGVTWIDGRDVGPRVADRTWSTSIVLLAELKAGVELLRGEPRLDESLDGRPLVGEVAVAERPLILGADERFLDALEQGTPALSGYLMEVLEWRATAASRLIEGEEP